MKKTTDKKEKTAKNLVAFYLAEFPDSKELEYWFHRYKEIERTTRITEE